MKNIIDKLKITCLVCVVLLLIDKTTYASTILDKNIYNNVLNIEYQVEKGEKDMFISNLESSIEYEEKEYRLLDYNMENQNYIDTIEINDIKDITVKSNSLTEILKYLPKTINYDSDGYVGINNLDYENIEVIPIYNGYYEVYVDEIKQYFDLIRNDMDFIPKEIEKDGLTLYLINVDWYTQTTKNTGDIEITDLYRGEALYRGVKRITNPYTYRVLAKYSGTAEKEIEKPYIVKVKYEEIKQEPEKNINMVIPITTGTSGIFIILIIFYLKDKVSVYCENKYIGRYKLKNKIVDITNKKINANQYQIKLSRRLYKKYKGQVITVKKGDLSKYCHIIGCNVEVNF